MSSTEIVEAASDPVFYTRVSYVSLKVAQAVASEDAGQPNHANRLNYAGRILRGDENVLMLTQHMVSSNPTIASTLETEGGAAVPDADIEFALSSIWDARSNAFAPPEPVT